MTFNELEAERERMLAIIERAHHQVYISWTLPLESFEFYGKDGKELIFYTIEYNEACHCHPEYTRNSFVMPTEIADTLDHVTLVNYFREEKEKKENAEKEIIQKEREEREKRAREEDLRKLAELKKKYENA